MSDIKIVGQSETVPDVFTPVPPALVDMRDNYVKWMPAWRMIRVSAAFRFAFEKPAVNLGTVVAEFCIWLINDEVYGVRQFLPENRRLQEITSEIVKWLENPEDDVKGKTEMMEALLPYGQQLTNADHVAAGCAWQVLFHILEGNASVFLRYFLAANRLAQPGKPDVALRAALEQSMRKLFELLKAPITG